MLTYGIDFDDVLAPFVPVACELANEEHPGLNAKPSDIRNWGYSGNEKIEIVSRYYGDERVFQRQKVSDAAKEFIRKLMKKGHVYIITAVAPQFMGIRAAQIKEAFPDFPEKNIIMGSNKSLVQFDITLDDGPNNILKSVARFPVLYRQPWNQSLSGMLSVNDFDEFFQLIEQIKSSLVEDLKVPKTPSVIALVGPSGSNKGELATELEAKRFAKRMYSYTTHMTNGVAGHRYISENDFDAADFIAKTVYAGVKYGMDKAEIEAHLKENENITILTDVGGAVALKRLYPTLIIFCRRSREHMIESILEKEKSNDEKKWRLLSMENELKNETLCDYVVRTDNVAGAAEEIMSLFSND